jgi:hypothetical protein
MKYKIVLGGRGSETYIHALTDEQKKILIDGEVQKDKMEYDRIMEVIGVPNFNDTDETYSGPYYSDDNYIIEVYNDKDEKIWDSYDDKEWEFNTELVEELDDWSTLVVNEDNRLIIEDYCKGNFKVLFLEIDGEFDPNLLSPKTVEINERIDIITGLYYNGVEIEDFEWDDTWSKGMYYYISNIEN